MDGRASGATFYRGQVYNSGGSGSLDLVASGVKLGNEETSLDITCGIYTLTRDMYVYLPSY